MQLDIYKQTVFYPQNGVEDRNQLSKTKEWDGVGA